MVHIQLVACLRFDGYQRTKSSLGQVCCGEWQDESGCSMVRKLGCDVRSFHQSEPFVPVFIEESPQKRIRLDIQELVLRL